MQMDPPTRPTLAVFDLDGTLTTRDTSLPFLAFAAGRIRLAMAMVARAPAFVDDLRRAVRLERSTVAPVSGSLLGRWGTLAHRRLIQALLRGRTRAELEEAGRRFASAPLGRFVSGAGLDRLRWHRDRGHRCVLVTASLRLYAEPWGRAAGFDRVLATRLGFDADERATGDFEGEPCWGDAKLRRLIDAEGPLDGRTLVVYGDSSGDRALLERADHPVALSGLAPWARVGLAERNRRPNR